jgi:hypothetical protein
MTAISPQRILIQEQETDYKSAVSEATLTRTGASINFINLRQFDTKQFELNGLYRKGVGVTGSDGVFPILFDMEIIAISMWNRRVNGTSGTTTFDLDWLSGSGTVVGSIFSTRPAFNTNVGNNAYMIRDVLNGVTVKAPATGATIPVLSKTQFNAGDAIRLTIDGAMVGAEDAALYIHFRPR